MSNDPNSSVLQGIDAEEPVRSTLGGLSRAYLADIAFVLTLLDEIALRRAPCACWAIADAPPASSPTTR